MSIAIRHGRLRSMKDTELELSKRADKRWGAPISGLREGRRYIVRASWRGEAVCACETMLFPWLGCKTRKSPPRTAVPLPIWYVSYLKACNRKSALVISPLPLDSSSDAESILSCLVAFPDVPNEFSNVFGCGFVALDPRCGWSRLALA